jgi:RNA polymerase sigma factor (sigma-70 family)
MSLDVLFASNEENRYYFTRFKEGDQAALEYFYAHAYDSLNRYGNMIIDDDFEVATIVQEVILKTWDYREHMNSMLHIYRFARLNVKWHCYEWFQQPANRLRRSIFLDEFIENKADSLGDSQDSASRHAIEEEQLKAIYDAMPYLPSDKQTIFMLHFKYGFSHKQIARRFRTSCGMISTQLKESLEFLEMTIRRVKMTPRNRARPSVPDSELKKRLTRQQIMIYQLRIASRCSIEAISAQTGLSPSLVLNEYIAAQKALKKLKQ